MPAKRALIMHPHDNVATAVEEIRAGEEVAVPVAGTALTLRATEAIPFGFKLALQDIPQGEIIRKYGETIGRAERGDRQGGAGPHPQSGRHAGPGRPREEERAMSFLGYVRSDGSVGTRNYVLVIPQGIIAKSVCDFVAGTRTILTVDHGSGRTANDREQIARLLIGLGRNPNVASVIVHAASPGVGYPELRAERLADEIAAGGKRVELLDPAKDGGTYGAIVRGIQLARQMVWEASTAATGNGRRRAPLCRREVRLFGHDVRDRRQPGGGVPLRQDRRRRGHGAVRGDHRDHRGRGRHWRGARRAPRLPRVSCAP